MDDRDLETMSDGELMSDLDVTRKKLGGLEGRQTKILDRLEQSSYAKTLGAHDLPRLISHRYRLDLAEAGRLVKFAVDLRKYPVVASALPSPGKVIPAGGVVLNLGQARAIMSALEQIPKSANIPVEELDAATQQMVEAGRHMKPSELQSMGVQVRNILDTDGPEPRENAARQRENLWITKAEDGVKFGGYLAGENAEKLQTVLQAGAKPHKTEDGDLDLRSRGKRQADALVDALDIALRSGDLPTRGGIKPHIAITINLNDLIEAGKHATGDLTYGDGLSASAIRRLACDAGIIPVVLGSDSQPLDVGREKRYVTDGLRNALNQRDRGCVVCHAPPIYCDAHHLVSWADGGVTSLANLVLLCRVDHTSLHDGHWAITIVDNQVQVTRPAWADPPARTGRRLNQPSTTSATASAPTATDPWPPSTDTGAPPATSDTDPWFEPAGADVPPATTRTRTRTPATVATDPWPPSTGTGAAAPAAADADPWLPPTGTGAPAATPTSVAVDADPWDSPDTAPATADAAGWAQSFVDDAMRGSADAGSAARPGWGWSHVDDIGWVSLEELGALDLWGDNSSDAEPSTAAEEPSDGPGAAEFDPWGDKSVGLESSTIVEKPVDALSPIAFDPWSDSA